MPPVAISRAHRSRAPAEWSPRAAGKSTLRSNRALAFPRQHAARYWCRHCHNEAEETVEAMTCVPPTSHTLDRYAVTEARASARQPAAALFDPLYGAGGVCPVQHAPACVQPVLDVRYTVRFEPVFCSISVPAVTLCRQVLLLHLQLLGPSRCRKEILPLRGLRHLPSRRPRKVRHLFTVCPLCLQSPCVCSSYSTAHCTSPSALFIATSVGTASAGSRSTTALTATSPAGLHICRV